jgi:DNA-binding IclR family transcriptional regulator
MAQWRLLTNHARVLACIALDPEVSRRGIASTVNINERTVFSIVDDLISGGYVAKEIDLGRRNRYRIQVDAPPLGEAFGRQQTIGELLKFLVGSQSARKQHSKGP